MTSAEFSNNTVYDIEIRDDLNNVHRASFYLENGFIHVAAGGRLLSVLAGHQRPDIAAGSLLKGHLLRESTRAEAKALRVPAE
jgi:hypothetical protein